MKPDETLLYLTNLQPRPSQHVWKLPRSAHCLCGLLLILNLSSARAQLPEVSASSHESIEWCDIWISHANETNLPRVLLIGDSIARDYYANVEKRLAGKAYVARLATSRFIGDPVLLQELALVLGNTKFQVIHFNNGMHGWQHSETEYQEAFPKFLATVRQYAPKAKLIWATTTPLRISNTGNSAEASDGRIDARNAIAQGYVTKLGIETDDLNTLMRGHPEYHRDNVHFNAQGIQLQSQQVAKAIGESLSQ
jgi:hypothetical protein